MTPAARARALLAGDLGALAAPGLDAVAVARAVVRAVHDERQFARVDEAALVRELTSVAAGGASDTVAAWLADARRGPVVTCGTYAPTLQLDVLGLAAEGERGPWLDVGCGPEALLVQALRARGIDAHGVDRHLDVIAPHLREADWVDAAGGRTWATITSHLGLSLHLLHAHAAGDATPLVRVWRELTRALAPGGVFAYAPSLPMLERALPARELAASRRPLPDALAAGLSPLSRALGEDLAWATTLTRR